MSDQGPLPPGLALLARPLSWMYGMGVAMRNARFDASAGVRRLARPVISIGNVTAGGTGKTPLVAWTAEALVRRGHHPLIAMRGYKAKAGERGDEEREYALLVPDIPVVANPSRYDAVSTSLASDASLTDCVLLDDGFQHRQIARDLDVVLVDATRPSLDGPLLPSGWLREPARALRRADAVIVTRCEQVDEALEASIKRHSGRAPLAWTRHAWRAIDIHEHGVTARTGVNWLRGKRLVAFCGIGNPGAVLSQLEQEGATVVRRVSAGDHANVDARVTRSLADAARAADAIFVTRKDWVKLQSHVAAIADMPPVVVPDLVIEFVDGESAYLAALRAAIAVETAGRR